MGSRKEVRSAGEAGEAYSLLPTPYSLYFKERGKVMSIGPGPTASGGLWMGNDIVAWPDGNGNVTTMSRAIGAQAGKAGTKEFGK